jgi:hypothetical protein
MAAFDDDILGAIPSHAKLRDVIHKDILDAQQRLTTQVTENPTTVEHATKAYLIDTFGIYARHHIRILRTSEQVRSLFGPYLLSLVDPILLYAMKITGHWRAPLDQHRLLQDVRTAMTLGIPLLTAEAYAFVDSLANAEPAPTTNNPVPAKLKKKRLDMIKKYRTEKNLTMGAFARREGSSETAIYGMVNGDRRRYEEGKLASLLKTLRIDRRDWDEL